MKKFTAIVNFQTLIVVCLSFISCYFTFTYRFTMYMNFFIFGLLIAFPITLTTKEAFKRRERALQYLSQFKSSLQSIYFAIINSKIEVSEKEFFRNIATSWTTMLIDYLKTEKPGDTSTLHVVADKVASFVFRNRKALGGSRPDKILFFLSRVNDSVEFLLATKRHRTPSGLNIVVKVAIFIFVIFYPATLLHETGASETFTYLFTSSVIKSIFLISLLNVQELLEDPFNQIGADDIRMDDFQFTTQVLPSR